MGKGGGGKGSGYGPKKTHAGRGKGWSSRDDDVIKRNEGAKDKIKIEKHAKKAALIDEGERSEEKEEEEHEKEEKGRKGDEVQDKKLQTIKARCGYCGLCKAVLRDCNGHCSRRPQCKAHPGTRGLDEQELAQLLAEYEEEKIDPGAAKRRRIVKAKEGHIQAWQPPTE
jgi:hypothetical protein